MSPVDSPDVEPFSTSEIAELKSLALTLERGGSNSCGALITRRSGMALGGIPLSDADQDLEAMRLFFKDAGSP